MILIAKVIPNDVVTTKSSRSVAVPFETATYQGRFGLVVRDSSNLNSAGDITTLVYQPDNLRVVKDIIKEITRVPLKPDERQIANWLIYEITTIAAKLGRDIVDENIESFVDDTLYCSDKFKPIILTFADLDEEEITISCIDNYNLDLEAFLTMENSISFLKCFKIFFIKVDKDVKYIKHLALEGDYYHVKVFENIIEEGNNYTNTYTYLSSDYTILSDYNATKVLTAIYPKKGENNMQFFLFGKVQPYILNDYICNTAKLHFKTKTASYNNFLVLKIII